jgi:hypothetical protein
LYLLHHHDGFQYVEHFFLDQGGISLNLNQGTTFVLNTQTEN